MISFSNALKITKQEFNKLKHKTEKVKLEDSLKRIIAEDIYSDTTQPPYTTSAMDGYAVKFRKGISDWHIIGEISAGKFKNFSLKENQAVLITTGAKMPESADTVIPHENVILSENKIYRKKSKPVSKGQNVRKRGADISIHRKVIPKKRLINSKDIQLAASCGMNTIKAYSKLNIGILTTGNELTDIKNIPKGDKVRASNLYSLISAAMEYGFTPVNFGILRDDKIKLKAEIRKALNSGIDILITSGGVSVGKYDFIPEIFGGLGIKIFFHKVNIKPGKPVLFGVYIKNRKRVLVFGLPGNPVSCYVNFILFIRNVYFSQFGILNLYKTKAVLMNKLIKHDNKRHFVRGKLTEKNGKIYVSSVRNQSSANSMGLSGANVLAEFPEKYNYLKAGSIVKCIKI